MDVNDKVAITGMGINVPGYTDPDMLFDFLYERRSLINYAKFGCEASPINIAASPIDDDQIATLESVYPSISGKYIAKSTKLAIHPVHQALKQAQVTPSAVGKRIGLFVGCNKNLPDLDIFNSLWSKSENSDGNAISPLDISRCMDSLRPQQATEILAKHFNFSGVVHTFADACIAGAAAIIAGYRRIQAGEIDVAVCGATEHATHPIIQLTFAKLGALCTGTEGVPQSFCRPFDEARSGCVLADGAGFIVLERYASAVTRGVRPLAILESGSSMSEAYKITSTSPDGSKYAFCIEAALQAAKLPASKIDHINAHGTSTLSNDLAEAHAIVKAYPHAPTVTSTKSALGHSLGGSSAIEAILAVISLARQKALPTLNYQRPGLNEPELNIVTHGNQQKLDFIASHSFGFGGENACLIFGRPN